jgi:hypothetical protein
MALVDTGLMFWPALQLPGGAINNALGQGQIAFDSAADRLAWVGRAPYADSLTTVYLTTRTVTTGCTINVRIETVTNGRPSGTLWATDTSASVVIADTDDNTVKTATLTAAASLSAGSEFAIVISVASGTPNMNFANVPGGAPGAWQAHYPLALQDTGAGAWALPSGGGNGFCWLAQFSTRGIVQMTNLHAAAGTGTITAYNSGTSPDERALRFQVPFKCRVIGIRACLFNIAAGADMTFSLWDATGDADGEALGQATLDGDFALSTTQDGYVDLFFSPVTLNIGTTYYAGVRADTANNIGLGELSNALVTNALSGFFGVNAQSCLATRTWTAGAAGAWSDTTTTLPLIYLIVDQLDDGAGGGGSAAFTANTRGNMQ